MDVVRVFRPMVMVVVVVIHVLAPVLLLVRNLLCPVFFRAFRLSCGMMGGVTSDLHVLLVLFVNSSSETDELNAERHFHSPAEVWPAAVCHVQPAPRAPTY